MQTLRDIVTNRVVLVVTSAALTALGGYLTQEFPQHFLALCKAGGS